MKDKELKKLDKYVKENGYNDKLKNLYLKEIIDQNKEYEWDQIPTKYSTSDKDSFSYW